MPTDRSTLACEIREGVARIALRHPPLNILDVPMMQELRAALARALESSETKVLVLEHEGKAFSAGVSIQDHRPDKVTEMLETFHRIFRTLDAFAVPSLALVDGMALGGGCELAVYCDLVIASDRATFGQPEIKVGVFPPIAAALFPRLIGRNRALELLLTGETVGAAEAKEMGLINKVFPAADFRTKADEFIRKLSSLSTSVLKLTKRAVDRGWSANVPDAIRAAEEIYLRELMETDDAREGLNAFLEKRNPVWKNR